MSDGSNPNLLIGELKFGWYSSPGLAWSPDGTRIAYFDPSDRLTLTDLQGGRKELVEGAPNSTVLQGQEGSIGPGALGEPGL
ncbi:hypothetical protein BH20ACT21_BH20ACT21_20120 [soil metagenome]